MKIKRKDLNFGIESFLTKKALHVSVITQFIKDKQIDTSKYKDVNELLTANWRSFANYINEGLIKATIKGVNVKTSNGGQEYADKKRQIWHNQIPNNVKLYWSYLKERAGDGIANINSVYKPFCDHYQVPIVELHDGHIEDVKFTCLKYYNGLKMIDSLNLLPIFAWRLKHNINRTAKNRFKDVKGDGVITSEMIANVQNIKRADANEWLSYVDSDFPRAGLIEWYDELNKLTKLTYNNEL